MDNVGFIQQEYEWSELPWKKFEKILYKLQKRIYQASKRGDVKNVRRLQKLLLKSRSAKCISVRKVTQDNQGAKTAGVDGVKSLSPKERLKLVDKITLSTKASPVRRVFIPKPGKDEKRPLGIPTMYDRALQCLAKMALEPEWEAKFEPNSYGFRPGRSCQDAIKAIFLAIKQKSKFVLDADISQCFDKIDHRKLLQRINYMEALEMGGKKT
ncbi:MAG: reverse transcriptase N-terminal domain-containing protein [Xenococcaceae cyanobacterium MO_167.B27]|nr:reverse transcriptase N-terminal domain-containing protein [Xenococcaceae cyanobacterium MO_167.B27]